MKNRLRLSAVLAGACFVTFALPLAAQAAPAGDIGYGITSGGNRLITFDPSNPASAGQGTTITGIGSGEAFAMIDTRPSTGALYGITDDASGNGRLYAINTATAVATAVSPGTTYALGDTINNQHYDMDFNPVSDVIRVVGSNGINLRISPSTGALIATDPTLAYASGDVNNTAANTPPAIGGAAYTGATGAATTTLYDADFVTNTLDTQGSVNGSPNSPNTGILNTVGGFGVDPSSLLGFDYSPTTNTAYLAAQVTNARGVSSSATQIYKVNLATGAATPVNSTGSSVGGVSNSDLLETFAVGPAPVPATSLPEFGAPAAAAVVGLGVGAFALRRRRRTV